MGDTMEHVLYGVFMTLGGILVGLVICTILGPSPSDYDHGACEAQGGTYSVIDDEYKCFTYKEIK